MPLLNAVTRVIDLTDSSSDAAQVDSNQAGWTFLGDDLALGGANIVLTNGAKSTGYNPLLNKKSGSPPAPGVVLVTDFDAKFRGLRIGGTASIPTAVLVNDLLVGIAGHGFDGAAFNQSSDGGITVRAAENFTPTANGTYIRFSLTKLGTVGDVDVFRMGPDLSFSIDTGLPSTPMFLKGNAAATGGVGNILDNITTQTTGKLTSMRTGGTEKLAWDVTGKPVVPVGGAAAVIGQSVLVAGTVPVSTTAVASSSLIFLTRAVTGGTQGDLRIGTITAGVSFTIVSANAADTSTVNWVIYN